MVHEVLTDELEDEELEQDQNLVFTIRSQEFGIQAVRVQEISRVLPTTKVPNAPAYIEGIMNLRGRLASVINFRKKLGFEPREHDDDTRVIVVELDTFPVGIIVDSVEEVIKIQDEKVQKLPESTTTSMSKDYMTGVGMLDNRMIILLDVDKVLTSAELIELGEINQMMEKSEETSGSVEAEEVIDNVDEAAKATEIKQTEREAKSEAAKQLNKSKEIDARQPQISEKRPTSRRTK